MSVYELSVMIFQQLSLSYNTNVSGDNHVTNLSRQHLCITLFHSYLLMQVTSTRRYLPHVTSAMTRLALISTVLPLCQSFSFLLFRPDERSSGRVGNKRRIRVRLDPAQYYADMRVSNVYTCKLEHSRQIGTQIIEVKCNSDR